MTASRDLWTLDFIISINKLIFIQYNHTIYTCIRPARKKTKATMMKIAMKCSRKRVCFQNGIC